MPGYTLRNEDYRAQLPTVEYPFGERSVLETDEVFIGTDVFTDAVIYLKEAAELPLHISSLDGTKVGLTGAEAGISDANGNLVATCELRSTSDEHEVRTLEGLLAGVIVTNRPGLVRLLGRIAGKLYSLLPSTAEFVPDVTFVSESRHLRYAKVGTNPAGEETGSVRIVAGRGVKFTYDEGVLRLHLLGDAESVLENGLRSINGVSAASIWLELHPLSNLRISSEGGQITFTSARDAV